MHIKVILLVTILSICLIKAEENKKESSETNESTKKRGLHEISYSFAATDINSPKGHHIKTITVIKNLGLKKDNETKAAKLNAELFKGEWGSKFRDNFDSYGKIPDFPNVDHYFKEEGDDKQEENAGENEGMQNKMEENNAEDDRKEIPIFENTEENQKIKAERNGKGEDKKLEEVPEDVELIKVDNPKSESKSESLVYVNPKHYQKYPKAPEIVKVYPQQYRNPPFYTSENPNFPYLTPVSYKSSYLPQPVLSPTIFLPVQNTTRKSTFITLSESRTTSKPPYIAPNNLKHKTIMNNNNNKVTPTKISTSSPIPYIAPNLRKDKLNPSKAASPEARFGFPLRLDNALVKISSSSPSTTQRSRGLRYR